MSVFFENGIRVASTLQHANDFQPKIDVDQLEQRNLQEDVIDLATCMIDRDRRADEAGIGITGAAAYFASHVTAFGNLVKTEIIIDLTGLNSGGAADDIIGDDGTGVAHLGQITAAVNGTIIAGRLTCLETPATGDDDIDIYSATEATGVEDTAIGDLTETQLCNSGDLTAGTAVALTPPAADQYLYLVGGTGGSATYSAGILLLEFWGLPATENLSLVRGVIGTNAPSLQTEDLRDVGATNRYARFQVPLPANYVAGETVTLRFSAGCLSNAADTTATLDVQCYKNDEDNTVSSDLCATDAQSINNTVFADKDFLITSTTLSPGDILDVQITVAINDAATGDEVIGCIAAIKRLCDTQG